MQKKLYFKNLLIWIIVIFIGVSVVPSMGISIVITPILQENITTVNDHNPGGYIQDLIDNASDGETIYIPKGIYYENIIINKSISLIGEDKNTTIIDGRGIGDVIEVTADRVTISGFTIQNSGDEIYNAGINIQSKNNTIKGNIISNNIYGIFSEGYGNSNSNTITGNIILNNNIGIELYKSNSNTIMYNSFIKNGLYIYESYQNNIISNTVNEKPLLYLEDKNDIVIDYEVGQVILVNCNKITIENLFLSDTDIGIELLKTDNCIIRNNDFSNNNLYGIYLRQSYSTTINGNTISNNNNGVILASSFNNKIIENKISVNKGYGIHLFGESSVNNKIYKNNFIDNGENAFDKGLNIYDDGKFGNYWDDYREKYPDAKRNLLKPWTWKTPYKIPGGLNWDLSPMITQWPNVKSRTVTKTTPSFSSFWLRFIDIYPMLQRILN